ncbi:unnamed protein product [Spirodela intermedia]|uniref:Rab-GAP TBC domain-containing protein n=2 Tax=Spirodela intermedia TaxID=51605 RepID=A0A7I8JU01_SPIIN|nr:unnamed protein product [Spirodela intermedia]CAA6673660.1 unnamed protein product [Spirodela intermedia]CAA7410901.1 unnamed protein product [Spirodela intermedia]
MKALLRSDACLACSPSTPLSSPSSSSSTSSSWIHLRSLLIITSSTPVRDRGGLRSPWTRMKRKHPLSFQQWINLFSPDGKLQDKVKLLKRVRNGGIEPGIRAEVWPFLLGVYDLSSTEAERNESRARRREEYEKLRERCLRLLRGGSDDGHQELKKTAGGSHARYPSSEEATPVTPACAVEDYAKWQRIIRLDALRAEWVPSSGKGHHTAEAARGAAEAVGLKDYEDLEPCRVHHAARLVAVLEAYAIYDPEIGYCQGMGDLLSPIAAVVEDDSEAFWCFAGFMRRARHNFRLDEAGIRRQLGVVARIIRHRDAALFRHLERHRAADCAFAYRMVVVLLRRELSFEQTLCLWEVLWADQAAVHAGVRQRRASPPTEDLLLYAIAACVLQRRKLIIEEDGGAEEILRECNALAGRLDVWRLLDEAHDLVLSLHGKI